MIVPLGIMVVELGTIAVTRRAARKLERYKVSDLITRHMMGDWGDADDDQCRANDEAVREEKGQIISAFFTETDNATLIVTDLDWPRTLVMLADEFWRYSQ